jgi:hypothetical protein
MPATYDTETNREKAADYVVLDRFDDLRRIAGHDYGVGQRRRELRRLERELESAGIRPLSLTLNVAEGDRDLELTASELRAAFDRVSRSKRARLEAEDYRRSTSATRATVETWRRLERDLAEDDENAAAMARFEASGFEPGEEVVDRSPLGDSLVRVMSIRADGFGAVVQLASGREAVVPLERLSREPSHPWGPRPGERSPSPAMAEREARAQDAAYSLPLEGDELRDELDVEEAVIDAVVAKIVALVPSHGGYGTARREVVRRVAERVGMTATDERVTELEAVAEELGVDLTPTVRISDGEAPLGARVESFRFGAGQPRVEGKLGASLAAGNVAVELDDGTRRIRSARNVRQVAP